MLTALLFDLDGTLTDTDTLHLQAFRQLLREHDGRELSQAQFDAQVSGRANGELFAELFSGASVEQCQALADRKEALFRAMSPSLEPMPGLLRLLGQHFEHVLVAEELARPKPDPLPYLTGLQRLGAEAGQALAFEDSLPGTAAASGAGIFTVGVATTQTPERLLAAGARLVVDDFNDAALWALIERMASDRGCVPEG